jgi:hypothetical protein
MDGGRPCPGRPPRPLLPDLQPATRQPVAQLVEADLVAEVLAERRCGDLRLPARIRVQRDPVPLLEERHRVDRVLPAAVVLRRPDHDLARRRADRDQPVARGQLRHVLRVQRVGDELHRLGLVLALGRDRERLRVRDLIPRLPLERRQQRPVEALRGLLDHPLGVVVALDGHRALAAEERRQHGRAGQADAGRVDGLVDVDHVVHQLRDRLLGGAELEHPLAVLEVVVLPAVVERERLDRRRRRAEAPADAVVAVRRELLRDRAELTPRPRVLGRRRLDPRLLEHVHVREDVVGLEHDRDAGDLAAVIDRVPDRLRDLLLEALRDQRRQVRQIALLEEAGDIRGLVVDDVRRRAADEARQQLVVDCIDVDRQDLHLDRRMALVPGRDDRIRRLDGRGLPDERRKVQVDDVLPGAAGLRCACGECDAQRRRRAQPEDLPHRRSAFRLVVH